MKAIVLLEHHKDRIALLFRTASRNISTPVLNWILDGHEKDNWLVRMKSVACL